MEERITKEAQHLINDWLKRTEIGLNFQNDSVSTFFVTKEWKHPPKSHIKHTPKIVTVKGKHSLFHNVPDIETLEEEINSNFAIESVDQLVDKNKVAKQVVAKLLRSEKRQDPNISMEERHRQVREKKVIREMEQKQREEEMKRREEVRSEAMKLLEQEERNKNLVCLEKSRIGKKNANAKNKKDIERILQQNKEMEETLRKTKLKKEEEIKERIKKKESFLLRIQGEVHKLKRTYFDLWRMLVVDRRMIVDHAVHIYKQKLLWKHLMAWNNHVVVDNVQNLKLAERHRNHTLMSHSFAKWTDFVRSLKNRKQVKSEFNKSKKSNKKLKSFVKMSTKSSVSKTKSIQPKNIEAPHESKSGNKRVLSAPIMKPKMVEVTGRCTSTRGHHSSTNDAFAAHMNNFAHRHEAQQKILEAQKNQINEQKRIIEELKLAKSLLTIHKKNSNPPARDHRRRSGEYDRTIKGRGGRPEKPHESEAECKHAILELKCDGENITWENINSPLKCDVDEAKNVQDASHVTKRVSRRQKRKPHLSTDDDDDVDYSKPVEEIIKDELKSILSSSKSSRLPTDITSKQKKFLKDMEQRNLEREKLKQEREEKKRMMEDEKLTQMQAEVEERKKAEAELKQKILLELKERKILEKEREIKKKQAEEQWREQVVKADNKRKTLLLKYWGWKPWVSLVQKQQAAQNGALSFYRECLKRKVLIAWNLIVVEDVAAKEDLVSAFRNSKLKQRYFNMWSESHARCVSNWQKACDHHGFVLVELTFGRWFEETKTRKSQFLAGMLIAQKHHDDQILHKCLDAWKELPRIREKERSRETRLQHLRSKISQIIPDFSPPISNT